MSKYDDINYLTYTEKNDKKLPIFENKNDLKEFPKEFNNQPIDKIRKFLLFENEEEQHLFDFMNNKQDYVSNTYLDKLNLFREDFSDEEKLNYLLDYIKEMYGVVTPEVFKNQLEKIFHLENSKFSENDYQKMIYHYFGKSQIDLENEQDREKFKAIIYDEEIKASNVQNIGVSQMFQNVPDNPVYVSNIQSNAAEEEDRRAEAA